MAAINVVWPEARLVVVCIPKVANSAIKTALLTSMGYDLGQMTLGRQLRLTPWAAPMLLRSYVRKRWLGRQPGRTYAWRSVHTTPLFRTASFESLGTRYRDYLKVGFVRHPLDRLVSCYRSKIAFNDHRPFQADGAHQDMTFDEFCQLVAATPDERANRHFLSQHRFLCDRDGGLVVDMLGRFERLAEDWGQVQARVQAFSGARLADLPRANQTAGAEEAWPASYTPELRARMAERYRTDLQRFGYAAAAETG